MLTIWKSLQFDVCDPEQHFRRVVPKRAQHCPILMKAICAISAWHLCRQGKFDEDRSNALYQQCLQSLIAITASPGVKSDDSILTAAVIMHVLEELRGRSFAMQNIRHQRNPLTMSRAIFTPGDPRSYRRRTLFHQCQ